MKTKQKIQRMKQMMLLICCLLPIFSSCSSDESSTANFTVRYQEHSPWTIDPAIVETILEYQDQQQLINNSIPITITITIDHAELTDEDLRDMAMQAAGQAFQNMEKYDYNQVIRDAGLSVSEPVTLTISYQVGLIGNWGDDIISYVSFPLEINLQ